MCACSNRVRVGVSDRETADNGWKHNFDLSKSHCDKLCGCLSLRQLPLDLQSGPGMPDRGEIDLIVLLGSQDRSCPQLERPRTVKLDSNRRGFFPFRELCR